jgi:hypothetical protein
MAVMMDDIANFFLKYKKHICEEILISSLNGGAYGECSVCLLDGF